jgi:HK97 family phage portal protein
MAWYHKLLNKKEKDYGASVVSGGLELISKLVGTSMSKTGMLEQYGKSLYVFACISKIATKTASIDFNLKRIINSSGDTKEIFSHPALDLLYKVNPFQTKTEFIENTVINLRCTGDAFWFKVRNSKGQVAELWNLRPDLMTVITDPVNFIKGYSITKFDGTEEKFAPDDIVHIKYPNPLNAYLGLSPLQAAQKRIQTEEFATTWQRDFFLNSARPDALIKNPMTTLTPDQKEDIREGWNKKHRGPGNSSKVAILEGGLDYQLISISQKEMDYIESLKFTRDDILVAFQVPKPIVAVVDDVNRANSETAMFIFLSETIKPEIARIVENINEQLIYEEFGEEFYIDFDDPTPANRDLQLREYKEGIEANYLLINEVRSKEGLPPVRGGWSFYMPVMNSATGGLNSADQKSLTKAIISESDENERIIKDANKPKQYNFKGRFMLKQKFILYENMEKAIRESSVSEKKTKKEKKNSKKSVSLIKEVDVRNGYAGMIMKAIDDKSSKLENESNAFFKKQEERVLKSLEKKAKGKNKALKVSDIFNSEKEKGLTVEFILPYISEYLKSSGQEALALLSPQEDFNTTKRIEAIIKKRAEQFAEEVGNTTLEGLESALAEGIAAGEGIVDLSKRVADEYNAFPSYRSERIARTEATAANNEGMLEGYKQSEVATGKEWIATMDNRTREEHAMLNGEIVALDKDFSNGLPYPSEPNCRCVIGPAILE